MNIIDKLKEHFLKDEKRKDKVSFWATDAEKPLFDLYHEWIGTKPTNPISSEKLIMFQAAKMIELALIDKLVQIGVARKQEQQLHIQMMRFKVPISGYVDGITVEGEPIEVKTFYGDWQAAELKAFKPKLAYLKQLAIYMDFMDKYSGKLIYMDRGTGEIYEFTLIRDPNKPNLFWCGNIGFDLDSVYSRWADFYQKNYLAGIEPKSEYVYKYPISTMMERASKSEISAARTNKAVWGDWQVKYSPYKDLILKQEGTGLGYSDQELEQIKELTKGYSAQK